LKGSPRKQIPAFADEIEVYLVVMGTEAHTGISGFFMGNTAVTILNRLDCSILAVKPPEIVTPVTLED
jgi:nucleotide-binding universal stress UspA family protein